MGFYASANGERLAKDYGLDHSVLPRLREIMGSQKTEHKPAWNY